MSLHARVRPPPATARLPASTPLSRTPAHASSAAVPVRAGMPAGMRAAAMRDAQRLHGNQAVQRLVRGAPAPAMAAPAAMSPAAIAPGAATTRAREVARAPAAAPATGDKHWWERLDFGDAVAWRMVDQFAPRLASVIRQGPSGVVLWLKDRAGEAAGKVVDRFLSPLQAMSGIGGQLAAQFAPMLAGLQDATVRIAANDCSPLSQAAQRIQATAERVVTPIVEKVQPVVVKIQGALGWAWDTLGTPVWSWIKSYASEQWDLMTQLASWIWSLGQPMRSLGTQAWDWMKDKIGIGDGPQGENGVLQWAQGKLESAWAGAKAVLAPFGAQIGAARAMLGSVSQAVLGPVTAALHLVPKVANGLGWLGANIGNGAAFVHGRSQVEKVLVPQLTSALGQMSGATTGAAAAISGSLGGLAGSLDGAAKAADNSVLHFAAPAVQWLAGEAHALAGWARDQTEGVARAFAAASSAFQRFLHWAGDFLHKLQGVVGNVRALPGLLLDSAWQRIPACIRDPVVDFLIPLLLKQIEIFEALVSDSGAWQKTKAQVMKIVRGIFVNGDLAGAARATFDLLLRAFNVPAELLAAVLSKAMAAWDVVSKNPIEFIKNTVRALGHGFRLMASNFGTHLQHGIEGWLFGALDEKGIKPPASWTSPKALFGFVLDVLGVSTSHVLGLMRQRLPPHLVDGAVRWVGRFQRAWDWINNAIDTSKSPAENAQGLVGQAKDFGKSILAGASGWVATKVMTELAQMAAAAAASGGLSEVLDIGRRIYRVILTAKRWAGQILRMASETFDHVLEIAAGNVSTAGAAFEKVMDRGMPVVIGFLADQVGLGGIGSAMRDIVDKLRENVDKAILWLIDKIKAGMGAVAGGVKAGVAALTDWWSGRRQFKSASGEPHALFFEGAQPTGQLMVASDEMPAAVFLTRVRKLAYQSDLGPHHRAATNLVEEIQKLTAALHAPDNHRDQADVGKLNSMFGALTKFLQPLIDLMYARSEREPGLVVCGHIRFLKKGGRIARVVAIGPVDDLPLEMITYSPMSKSGKIGQPGKIPVHPKGNRAPFYEVAILDARTRYMVPNPTAKKVEDREILDKVLSRMIRQGKVLNKKTGKNLAVGEHVADGDIEILYEGKYYPKTECDLGHVIDAVHWWNTNGIFEGPQSQAVKAFMRNPDNYIFEPQRPNREKGRALEARYDLPVSRPQSSPDDPCK